MGGGGQEGMGSAWSVGLGQALWVVGWIGYILVCDGLGQ